MPKNAIIYQQGFPADAVFFLRDGTVKLLGLSAMGTQRIVGILKSGEMFGLDSLLPGRTRVFTAVTRDRSQLCFIERGLFIRALRSAPDLLWKFSTVLNLAMHEAQQEKLTTAGSSVHNRLEIALNECGKRNLRLKQIELAELIGATPETVNRELHRGRISFPDPERLALSRPNG